MMRLLRRVIFLFRRRDDLAEELEFHRRMKEDELRAAGVGEHEIKAATERAMGNDLLAREHARDVWIAPTLQDISQDIKFSVRTLVKERRFTATAIVTLALGIAVSNAVFTFVNATLFKQLPFAAPDRLLTIRTLDEYGFQEGVSWPEFIEWQRNTTAFESLSADVTQSMNLSDDAHSAERLSGSFVTHNTFGTLGVAPILGRDFVPADDIEGAAPVVMLSYSLWRGRYGGDPGVVGRVIRVNERPSTVIGVMPDGFTYPLAVDLWVPMGGLPNLANAIWVSRAFGTAGRLKASADIAQAKAEVETIAARIAHDHPEIKGDRRIRVVNLKEGTIAPDAWSLMIALLAGATVVLAVASANVANLQLARSWHHARDTAVRMAMGASRWRVMRQVLVECIVLGTAGSALGAYLSLFGFRAMASAFNVMEYGALDRPRRVYWFDGTIDGASWVFFAGAFLVASVGAALIPSWQMSSASAGDALKDGRSGQSTRRSRWWASALTIGQLAVAFVLMTCGGLLARSFLSLYNTSPVIAIQDIVTMQLTLPAAKYPTPDQRRQFARLLDERLASTSVFAESTLASDIPLQPLAAGTRLVIIDGAEDRDNPPRVTYITAGPRFFSTLKFHAIRGRELTPEDGRAGSEGVVINERAATVLFGGADPIGARIRLALPGAPAGTPDRRVTVVGIVPTVPDFLPQPRMVVYAPMLTETVFGRGISVMVRATSKAAAASALREQVRAIDADLPVHQIMTLEELLAFTRSGARMVGSWFQTLAIIALVLACVGVFAMNAHGVAQRKHEIGVRMAIGARATQVTWLFVRQTIVLLVIGIGIGFATALAFTPLLASFLGGINPRDSITFIVVLGILTVIGLLSGFAPARRAARIDPAITLRAD